MNSLNCYEEENVTMIIHQYSNMVYRIAYSRTKDKNHAEDVFQEVFLRLIKKKPKFESNEHLKAWLIRVTINCSKSTMLSLYLKRNASLENDIIAPNMEYEKSDLYYLVKELPSKYKHPIYLFYYEGYSVKEISTMLGKKEATIKTNLHRGRKMLKVVMMTLCVLLCFYVNSLIGEKMFVINYNGQNLINSPQIEGIYSDVSFSGIVEEVSRDKMQIKIAGKWIVIDENTEFYNKERNMAISNIFNIGNYVEGSTNDDMNSSLVRATNIYTNIK